MAVLTHLHKAGKVSEVFQSQGNTQLHNLQRASKRNKLHEIWQGSRHATSKICLLKDF